MELKAQRWSYAAVFFHVIYELVPWRGSWGLWFLEKLIGFILESETLEGRAADALPCWQIYTSKNAGLDGYCDLNVKLLEIPPLTLLLERTVLQRNTRQIIQQGVLHTQAELDQ